MNEVEELREELQEKTNLYRQIFSEAEVKDEHGEEAFDLTNVDCLGTSVNDLEGTEKVKRVQEISDGLEARMDEIEREIATYEAVESFRAREKSLKEKRNRQPRVDALPSGVKDRGKAMSFKQIARRITEDPIYQSWRRGSKDGRIRIDASWLEAKALMTTAAGFPPEVTRTGTMVEVPLRPSQVVDILPRGATSQGSIEYMTQTTRTEGAVEIAEGAAKPEATYVWAPATDPVREIAHNIPVTDTMLDDAPFMASIIEGQLREGVDERLDAQAIVGDGVDPNLEGILNKAGILTLSAVGTPVPTAIRQGIANIRTGVARAVATHVLMHPDDWTTTSTLQTADGEYIFGNPGEVVVPRIWGLPVVENESLTQGTALIASMLATNIQLVERMGIFVERGLSGDDFIQNRQHIKAWGRWALAVYRPAAFLTVTGLFT